MRVIRETDAKAYLARVGPHLGQSPGENNLLLGLLADIARAGAVPGRELEYANVSPVLLSVEGARGRLEAVALQTPPRSFVVSRASDEAVRALVTFALSANLALPGVVGPSATAERFAAAWTTQTGRASALREDELVYELDRVEPPQAPGGRLREAASGDEALLAAWSNAFIAETRMDPIADCLAFVRNKTSRGQLFVWDDGAPVSMAAWVGRSEYGVRIGYVYTPPGERKKGYASAIVAGLSQRLLDEGIPRCFLFTQAANPTSNKIYRAIGYRHVCDFRMYAFAAG